MLMRDILQPRRKTPGTPKPLLIGLYSPRPSQGKTTTALALADILKASRGTETAFRPFAEPLKMVASAFLEFGLGLSDVEATRALYRDKDKEVPGYDFSGRQVLTWLGTDVGRSKMGEHIWVDRTTRLLEGDMGSGRNVIVDDVRMENEYQDLRDRGALMVRIVRDMEMSGPAIQTTETEGRLEDRKWDLQLTNRGTLADLKTKLRSWVKDLPR